MKLVKLHSRPNIDFYSAEIGVSLALPYYETGVSAGFPSPADDFLDAKIDLNKEFIKNPSSTFYCRVKGHSLNGAGIHDGDLLIIDKSIEPGNNKIAVCFVNGEFTVKRIRIEKDCCYLLPENPAYKPIKVTPENDFVIWGIVVHVIKTL